MSDFGVPYSTSYFSAPSSTLDPQLFDGRHLKSWVRQGVLTLLNDFFQQSFRHSDLWSRVWLAGSGVSYQWSASRQPADLDCLVGVDYVQFRKANPEFAGLSDKEISEQINELFRSSLQPRTEDWNGFELTFYVNPGATDIRSIKPYAAYNLNYDEWTVAPDPSAHAPYDPSWESAVSNDRDMAKNIATRFTGAFNDIQVAHNDALRRNAQSRLELALNQGEALYDEIHHGRREAFAPTGNGYADFHNYRWQAGKREGTVQILRSIHQHAEDSRTASQSQLYGVDFPTADTLIRRAALYRATR